MSGVEGAEPGELETKNELVSLSALQHYLYCPRQCALIHVERQWSENRLTAEGRVLHDRADAPGCERRGDVRTVTAMPLHCRRLAIAGIADVVEFHNTPEGDRPFPVEYKRGRPKAHRADEVQLCAQALCLEEMLGVSIPEGALFYGRTRRRRSVVFDNELRALTEQIAKQTRTLIDRGSTPLPKYESRLCDNCSLFQLCQPKRLSNAGKVKTWLKRQIKE